MVARRSVWANDVVQKLMQNFIPVADEVWRLQHRKQADALVFQSFCEQGHYGGRSQPSDTRQGIYAVAASGAFLASINTRSAKAMVKMLRRALERFAHLDEAAKSLDAETRKALENVRRSADLCPEDGLVLRVASRDFPGSAARRPWHETARNLDWAWFRKAEAAAFVPQRHEVGQERELPSSLIQRIVRCHLLDNVRGQTTAFRVEDLRRAELRSRIIAKNGSQLQLLLLGTSLAERRGGDWQRGFETKLRGVAVWDQDLGRFLSFELVAAGQRWGRTRFNARTGGRASRRAPRAERSDAEPIGVHFELLPTERRLRVAPAHLHEYGW